MSRSTVSMASLRKTLASCLRLVSQGGEVIVTRNGVSIAKLIPAMDEDSRLRAVGLRPPERTGVVPRVQPTSRTLARSLTRAVLEGRD